MKQILITMALVFAGRLLAVEQAAAATRPNILWITCEDMSPDLGSFGDAYARTPQLDGLAREGVRFTRTFASASVCSPVRSGIITGMYATSLGTEHLRSAFPVPAHVRAFTTWLREAGYYCCNNVKTDYNLQNEPAFIRAAWDESSPRAHWRNRKPGQPFFAVFNLMETHQSRASVNSHAEFERAIGSRLKPAERHDPAKVTVPSYYPDTPEVRRTLARYYDCVTVMDKEVGAILRRLGEEDLAEDTIVFFYSDHGRGLPRGKRTLFDSGLQIPLIIRFPAKFKDFAPGPAGSVCDRLVSTIDFGPTVLSLAGLKVPEHMQGVPFLGAAAGPARPVVFGARDRVDEAFDLSRSVRDGRYLYIRNFMPHLSWMQPEAYSDQSTMRRELKRLAAENKLGSDQLTYAASRRAVEELYDTEADPQQIHNLAGAPAQAATRERLGGQLREWLLGTRDAAFLPEPLMWQRIGTNATPFDLARDPQRYPLPRLLEAAELVGRSNSVPRLVELLGDADDGVRYWAAVGLVAAGNDAAPARDALRRALQDSSAVVRIEAATALARLGDAETALPALATELRTAQPGVMLPAARALELLGETARPALPAMTEALKTTEGRGGDAWMYVRFSLKASIDALLGDSKPAVVVEDRAALAQRILDDAELRRVLGLARGLMIDSLTAGSGYGEVWIRDLNTFIEIALAGNDAAPVRDALLTFFKFQGPDGEIVDGYIPAEKANVEYKYRKSEHAPGLLAHKNTVETDQETSLIQAIQKFIRCTGDRGILKQEIAGNCVLDRSEGALEWLLNERLDKTYGLLWGATTVDWGDVQPEHKWGVELDEQSHRAIDIYDNAMFVVALDVFIGWVKDDPARAARWLRVRDDVTRNIRRHLWDAQRQKFIPHIYLAGSPFPKDFDESAVWYHGGTAVAIEAGLLNTEEIRATLAAMRANVKQSGAASIGLTVYPPYPQGTFLNPGLAPWSYQNGGDWCWFGGRMVQQLIRYGFVGEAYEELKPMVSRVERHKGFYEWWTRDNQPKGSGQFRGSAGVLGRAIEMLLDWAKKNRPPAAPAK